MRLTEGQQQTLRAAVDRIIPADDYPGAWEAGVGDYLARQFDGDLLPVLDIYLSGLTALEAEAEARFQRGFRFLTPDQQDLLLQRVDVDDVLATWDVLPSRFFDLLVITTAEGFYSEPEQGGNRAAISWAMTSFEMRAER